MLKTWCISLAPCTLPTRKKKKKKQNKWTSPQDILSTVPTAPLLEKKKLLHAPGPALLHLCSFDGLFLTTSHYNYVSPAFSPKVCLAYNLTTKKIMAVSTSALFLYTLHSTGTQLFAIMNSWMNDILFIGPKWSYYWFRCTLHRN